MEAEFSRMISSRAWNSPETVCGPGSTLESCRGILQVLPGWLSRHRITSIVDAGCGDFHWMSQVDLSGIQYDGYDVVQELIAGNRQRYCAPGIRFHHADVSLESLPKSDLVICKDVLIHLPSDLALSTLERIRSSGSRYLAATSSPGWPASNRAGMVIGGFSPIDLGSLPFSLGAAIEAVAVPGSPGHPRKTLSLWDLQHLK